MSREIQYSMDLANLIYDVYGQALPRRRYKGGEGYSGGYLGTPGCIMQVYLGRVYLYMGYLIAYVTDRGVSMGKCHQFRQQNMTPGYVMIIN